MKTILVEKMSKQKNKIDAELPLCVLNFDNFNQTGRRQLHIYLFSSGVVTEY